MKVALWMVGKTAFDYLKDGIQLYEKRLGHYLSFSMKVIPDLKNTKKLTPELIKKKEGEVILNQVPADSFVILLDERGKSFPSTAFAHFMEQQLQLSHRQIVFIIGGAYGFSDAVYERSNFKLSLSPMTFSHQMVRLFFVEQLYRAMTIIRREPYHHQ